MAMKSFVSLRFLYVAVSLGLLSLCVLTLWEALVGNGPLLNIMERYFSPDNKIEIPLKRYSQIVLISGWLAGLMLFCRTHYPTLAQLPRVKPLAVYVLVAIMSGVYLADRHGVIALPLFIYEDDGPFEWFTAIGFLVSAAVLLLVAIRATGKKTRLGFRIATCVIALALFLLAMEEISWGQRLIGWESPDYFMNNNDQQETNFHNFYNDYIWIAYQIFAMLVGSLIVFTEQPWLRSTLARLLPGSERLLPAKHYFYFAIAFVLLALYNELFEEIFAVFALAYSIELLRNQTNTQSKPSSLGDNT